MSRLWLQGGYAFPAKLMVVDAFQVPACLQR
jgi:hypothetical protein